jgi:hypothetical protein
MMNDAFRTDYHNNIEAIHLITEKERIVNYMITIK